MLQMRRCGVNMYLIRGGSPTVVSITIGSGVVVTRAEHPVGTHDKDAVGRQAVHAVLNCLPLGRLFT